MVVRKWCRTYNSIYILSFSRNLPYRRYTKIMLSLIPKNSLLFFLKNSQKISINIYCLCSRDTEYFKIICNEERYGRDTTFHKYFFIASWS